MSCERKEAGVAGGIRLDADRIGYVDFRRDGCCLYVLGVDALKEREERAMEYIERVRKLRTKQMTWGILWTEVALVMVIILLLCVLKGVAV